MYVLLSKLEYTIQFIQCESTEMMSLLVVSVYVGN